MSNAPVDIHQLDNGWEVRELHAVEKRAFTAKPSNTSAGIARFVVRFIRRHHRKQLTVVHLIGATAEEQEGSVRTALRWASNPTRFPLQGHWRRKRDPKHPGKYLYTVIVGDPIDEVKVFESLTRELDASSEIDRQFEEIIQAQVPSRSMRGAA